MKSFIRLLFATFNCSIITFSMIFYLLNEEDISSYFSILLFSTMIICLFINVSYLGYIISSAFESSRKNKFSKNYFNTDTIQKNVVLQNTLPLEEKNQ